MIPSHLELSYDIDDSDDNENQEDDEDKEKDDDHDHEDDDLSPFLVVSEEADYMCCFKPFNFLVQQHENTKPTESNTTNYILFGFV